MSSAAAVTTTHSLARLRSLSPAPSSDSVPHCLCESVTPGSECSLHQQPHQQIHAPPTSTQTPTHPLTHAWTHTVVDRRINSSFVSLCLSRSELSRAFRRKSLRIHPDKNPDPKAREAFDALNDLYQKLQEPITRCEVHPYHMRGFLIPLGLMLCPTDMPHIRCPSSSAVLRAEPRARSGRLQS
jgi:hypothetical protein